MAHRPIGIAAGIIKSARDVGAGLPFLVDHITFGSYTLEKREGNLEPVYWFDPVTRMSMNAVGLANEGIEHFLAEELFPVYRVRYAGCKMRISLAPLKAGDLASMIAILRAYGFPNEHLEEIEVNAACPNHRDDDGNLHEVLAHDPIALEALMAEAEAYDGPKAIKLAPCMTLEHLENAVHLARKYRFTSIVSGNTIPMDARVGGTKRLSVPRGGMAGAPLFDYALLQIETLKQMVSRVTPHGEKRIRLIASGGILNTDNARRFSIAGADMLQVATYYMEYGENGIRDLVTELI
jgi:dihydroorotate dehydrogenase